jgi:precorrin-2 dehydrogenase/sirohydrochlorin ferrochelatase
MSMYYPAMIKLQGKRCLVVGGGSVAARKINSFLESGASVKVVSPELCDELKEVLEQGMIEWVARRFEPRDIEGVFIVVAATNDGAVNETVAALADQAGCLVNVVERPERGNYIVPSTIRRGLLHIAISSAGASPGLSKKIRQELEEKFPPYYEEYVTFLADARRRIMKEIHDQDIRRRLFQHLLEEEWLQLFASGDLEEVKDRLTLIIKRYSTSETDSSYQ